MVGGTGWLHKEWGGGESLRCQNGQNYEEPRELRNEKGVLCSWRIPVFEHLVPETWAAGSRCFLAGVHPLDCHPGAGEPLHWANPMAIHGLWLGPGQHVGTQDCSFSGPAVVVGGGGGQHSSVCICSGSPTKIKASLFHRLLWPAASNDSRPASQHAFVVCLFGLWERLK